MKRAAVLSVCLLAACQHLSPSPESARSAVETASRAWASAFNSCDASGAAALYSPDAALWGTFSRTLILGREGIQRYFERVCSMAQSPTVSFGEQRIRVYGDVAINSGTYTFGVAGADRALPARYSFTYRHVDGKWLIADHHSSQVPAAAPRPSR